jgi:hypothetical protein
LTLQREVVAALLRDFASMIDATPGNPGLEWIMRQPGAGVLSCSGCDPATDPKRNVTSYGYDVLGRQTGVREVGRTG